MTPDSPRDRREVGEQVKSPLAIAPPFRGLRERYPVESLEETFAEGISTGHPTMPQFRFEPDQTTNLIAFLKSLQLRSFMP